MKSQALAAAWFVCATMFGASLSSCASRDAQTQLADTAFIVFDGDTEDLYLKVDDGAPIELRSATDTRYRVGTGRHRLRVLDDGQVIVDRVVFLSRGQVLEVLLP